VQISTHPVRIVSYTPQTINITLEKIVTRNLPIHLVETGDIAVGFETHDPLLSVTTATVTGPESQIRQVEEIRANLDLSGANKPIDKVINLQAVDVNGKVMEGIPLSPTSVKVTQEIVQKGGFRNVVVKVNLKGQVAEGYRLTNISVYPPIITVFSQDQKLVDNLPGMIWTKTWVSTYPMEYLSLETNLSGCRSILLP
jgi:YbbR domain-containing protein